MLSPPGGCKPGKMPKSQKKNGLTHWLGWLHGHLEGKESAVARSLGTPVDRLGSRNSR
jgi:hypothetical protein